MGEVSGATNSISTPYRRQLSRKQGSAILLLPPDWRTEGGVAATLRSSNVFFPLSVRKPYLTSLHSTPPWPSWESAVSPNLVTPKLVERKGVKTSNTFQSGYTMRCRGTAISSSVVPLTVTQPRSVKPLSPQGSSSLFATGRASRVGAW